MTATTDLDRKPWLPPRWFIHLAWRAHRAIFRLTGGRRGLAAPTSAKFGYMRLHTVGRKSGRERAAILGYFEDGPNLVTLAMNGWGEAEPAWWLNLLANPEAEIDLKTGTRQIRARAAAGEERARQRGSRTTTAVSPGRGPEPTDAPNRAAGGARRRRGGRRSAHRRRCCPHP